ncbi:MAG: PIN domain-containing protein [Dehalococcoidia bacterium]
MTLFLIDTPTLIDYSKGREPVRTRFFEADGRGDDLATCDIVVAEFLTGVGEEARPAWESFFRALRYLPTPLEAATLAGDLRRRYRHLGIQLTTTDTLIAATALHHDAVLVTENPRDFPMPELRRESWRTPP